MRLPSYTPDQVAYFQQEARRWIADGTALTRRLYARTYVSPDARHAAVLGLGRRLGLMSHAIGRIYDLIPPDHETPSSTDVSEVTVHLQAFSIHAYGAVDNLAQIWVHETGATDGGRPIRRTRIGFGADREEVRRSLPDDLRLHLETEGFLNWLTYLEDFRHAIAHRVPLYVPPKTMTPEEIAQYRALETDLAQVAIVLDGRWDEIWSAMESLGRFVPIMVPELSDDMRPVWFHGQIVSDLSTVVDLGNRVFDAMDAQVAAIPAA